MKLSINGILTESWGFYKANFPKLAVYAGLGLLYMLLFNFSTFYPATFETTALYAWLSFAAMIALIIVAPKFVMAVCIYVNALMQGENISFRQAFRATKGRYWRFVGYVVLFSLITLPLLGLFVALSNIRDWNFSNIFSPLFLTVSTAIFYLLFPLIALEDNGKGLVYKSMQLVVGNFGRILVFVLLTVTIIALPQTILLEIYGEYPLNRLIITSGYALINFFISPFADVVCITVYRKLMHNSQNELTTA